MEEDLLKLEINKEVKEDPNFSKIVLVRHGESVANTQGIYQGQTFDTDLSELGQMQALAVAARLSEIGIRHIIASPLKRTYQTALEIAKAIGSDIYIDERIIETNHGVWEGRPKDWIVNSFPDLYALWAQKPSEVVFPEGEAFLNTIARVQNFMEDTNLDDDTIIVTHDNIVRIILALSANIPIDLIWRFELESGALNFFEKTRQNGKSKYRLLMANDTRHLEGLRANISQHAL